MNTRIYFKNTLDSVKKLIYIFILINITLCLFTLLKSTMGFLDSIILYGSTMLWAAVFMLCIVKFNKEWITGLLIVLMIEAGIMFQSIIAPVSATKIPIFLLAGTIAGLVFIAVSYLILDKLHERFSIVYEVLCAVAFFACYALLLFKGYDPNNSGVAIWIKVGSFTLQLTEFMKLFLVLFISSIFSSKRNDNQKLWITLIAVMISAVFFALLNELGTILIVVLVYIITSFIYLPKEKAMIVLLSMLMILVMGTLIVLVERHLLTDKLGKISTISSKLYDRVLAVIAPNQGALTYAYQNTQGRKAICVGGLFGSKYQVANFALESDMALTGLINHCGLICALLVMVCYGICTIMNLKLISTRNQLMNLHQTQNVLFIFMFAVQSFYAAFANLGYLPLTGIPMPFLSAGGTAYMITLIYFFSILFLDNNYRKGRKKYE